MRRYGITASALALLFFLAFPLDTSASGKEYVMTETELTALESGLKKLGSENERQKQESEKLKTALSASQKALERAEQESAKQSGQLSGLRMQAKEQEKLLQRAGESLAAFEKEQKRKNERIRRQRNLAYAIATGLAIAYSRKCKGPCRTSDSLAGLFLLFWLFVFQMPRRSLIMCLIIKTFGDSRCFSLFLLWLARPLLPFYEELLPLS